MLTVSLSIVLFVGEFNFCAFFHDNSLLAGGAVFRKRLQDDGAFWLKVESKEGVSEGLAESRGSNMTTRLDAFCVRQQKVVGRAEFGRDTAKGKQIFTHFILLVATWLGKFCMCAWPRSSDSSILLTWGRPLFFF